MSVSDFYPLSGGDKISLSVGDNNVGPFVFDCSPQIPLGKYLSGVTVTTEPLSGATASNLATSYYVSSRNTVNVRFTVPSNTPSGPYRMRIRLSLSDGSVRILTFSDLWVK